MVESSAFAAETEIAAGREGINAAVPFGCDEGCAVVCEHLRRARSPVPRSDGETETHLAEIERPASTATGSAGAH